MPAHRFRWAIITIHKRCVGLPSSRRLVLQLCAARVFCLDPFANLEIHSLLNQRLHLVELRCNPTNVIETGAIV